jgi:hypothetical protein
MLVSGLAMHQLAKHALADQIKHEQNVAVIADVFQDHAGLTRLLRGIHEFPTFREGGGHLGGSVFAGLHRRDGNRSM